MLKLFDLKTLFVGLWSCISVFIGLPMAMAQGAEESAQEQVAQGVEENSEKKADANTEERDSLPYWKKSAYWLADSRDAWSDRVGWMAQGIDRFFAGDETLNFGNKSYVRFRTSAAWIEGQGLIDDSDIKFRLHLPATKHRFNVVIENEPEEKQSLEEKARPSLVQATGVEDSRLTAAVEFVRAEAKLWKTKASFGVKARIPSDLFVKFSAKRRWTLKNSWTMPYQFKAAEYLEDEWEIKHSLAFERPLPNELFFSARTSMEWAEDESAVAAQIFSLRKRLSDRRGIDYRVGVIGADVAKPRVTSYFLGAHYRELLYKDWLYWNIIPEVNFPRGNGFSSVFSLTARFEVFFQK